MIHQSKTTQKVVLAIFAHPDDAELSCGGTLLKLASEGAKCYVLNLTRGEKATGAFLDRYVEAKNAAELLGYELIQGDFDDGNVFFDGQTVGYIDKVLKQLKPSIIITHFPQHGGEGHQDHLNTSKAVLNSSFRHEFIEWLLYAEPQTHNLDFNPNYFVDISNFFSLKLQALSEHKSQQHKHYFQKEFVLHNARHWSMRYHLPGSSNPESFYEGFLLVKGVV